MNAPTITFEGFHKGSAGHECALIGNTHERGTWLRGDLLHRDGKVYIIPFGGIDSMDNYEVVPDTVRWDGKVDRAPLKNNFKNFIDHDKTNYVEKPDGLHELTVTITLEEYRFLLEAYIQHELKTTVQNKELLRIRELLNGGEARE